MSSIEPRESNWKKPHKRSGPHPHEALSARGVATITKPGKYCDGNGLMLVVDRNLGKRWVLRTVIHGRRTDLGLGSVALVSLAEARKQATAMRAIARSGGDPIAERRKARIVAPTFEQVAREVYKAHAPSWRNAKHAEVWIASLENDVFDIIGTMPVDRIETADVLKVLLPIWLKKPETARRIKQRIRLVMDWCKSAGYRTGDNPIDGLKAVLPTQTDKPVHHPAMPYAEIPAFIADLRACDALPITKLAFEFLILTAARTAEALGAMDSEFDLDAALWTIPGNRMKAGKAHRVPLTPRCIEIVTEAKKYDYKRGPGYVFCNPITGERLSNMVLLMLQRRIRPGYVPHGFRSSFRDWAAERTSTPHAVMEAALAHTERDKTVAAYARSDLLDLRRKLMELWTQHCTAPRAEILPIRRQA